MTGIRRIDMKEWTLLGIKRQTTKYADAFKCTAYLYADIDKDSVIRYWEISEWDDLRYPLIYTAHPTRITHES